MKDKRLDNTKFIEKHIKDPVDYLFSHLPTFDFSKTHLYWRDNSPLKTFFDNAFSLALPQIEYFIIETMKEVKGKTKDEALIQQLDIFCEQEDRHAHAHGTFNNHLKEQNFDVERYKNKINKVLDKYRKRSLEEKLLACTLFESMTAVLSKFFFITSRNDVFDPPVYKLFAWHCIEELEHRCIAFYAYKSQIANYNPPFFKTFILSMRSLGMALSITAHSLYKQKSLFKIRNFKDLFWLFGIRKGPLIAFLLGYINFLKKNYDPKSLFDEESLNNCINEWEKKYHSVKGNHSQPTSVVP